MRSSDQSPLSIKWVWQVKPIRFQYLNRSHKVINYVNPLSAVTFQRSLCLTSDTQRECCQLLQSFTCYIREQIACDLDMFPSKFTKFIYVSGRQESDLSIPGGNCFGEWTISKIQIIKIPIVTIRDKKLN